MMWSSCIVSASQKCNTGNMNYMMIFRDFLGPVLRFHSKPQESRVMLSRIYLFHRCSVDDPLGMEWYYVSSHDFLGTVLQTTLRKKIEKLGCCPTQWPSTGGKPKLNFAKLAIFDCDVMPVRTGRMDPSEQPNIQCTHVTCLWLMDKNYIVLHSLFPEPKKTGGFIDLTKWLDGILHAFLAAEAIPPKAWKSC